jgi:lysozyme
VTVLTPDDLAALRAQLRGDEGERLVVYDDATGLPIRAGSVVQGNPTIGIGRELSKHGISKAESAYLNNNDILEVSTELAQLYPWFLKLDVIRQRAIIDLAFNEGAHGLQKSPKMLAAIAAQDWPSAARELMDGPWHVRVGPRRSGVVRTMLLTGMDPAKGTVAT